jgi:hypothetical protein
LDVPEEVVTKLNQAARNRSDRGLKDSADDIDIAIKALTALTYPATIETVGSDRSGDGVRYFMLMLRVIGGVGFLLAIACAVVLQAASKKYEMPPWFVAGATMILPAVLGLLGCITYIYFNVIGLLSEKAFNLEDTQTNYVRLSLGCMLGWIFYFFFCRDAFEALSIPQAPGAQKPILLLVPFLVGFSTKLVVGVLNQAIRAAELTLGLENKGAQLAQRRTTRNTGGSNPGPVQ